jgi:hypothetical protein
LVRLLAAVAVAAAAATLIADVVLNPGYIAGTYQVQGVTLSSASFQASSGTGSSSVSSTSGSYQLTVNVPAGGSQQYTLYSYFYSDQGRDYLQAPTRTVIVGDGLTSTQNFAVVPGIVQGTITVNGGTASSASVYADETQTTGTYASTSLLSPYTSFSFPANPGLNNVGGTVTVSGVSYTLPAQQVTVVAGQVVTVDFTVTVTQNTGVISGSVQVSGAPSPNRIDVYASGPASPWVQLSQPGPYALTALPNGNYTMYAYAFFNNYQDNLYLPYASFAPSRSVTISAGAGVQRDVTFAVRSVSGNLTVTGPRTLSHVTYGQVGAGGLSPSAAFGGNANARLALPSGTYVLPLTDGSWRPRVYLQFTDSNPQTYLNSSIDVVDNRPANTITVSGAATTWPTIAYEVGTVSVVMGVPSPFTFSNPSVSGWCYERDSNNVLLRQYYVNASRAVFNVSTATVTFVGLKGSCDLQARVNMSGGSTSIGTVQTAVVPGVETNVDIGGPTLTMTSPSPNEATTGTSIAVGGTATDDAQVQSVTVNNAAQTLTSTNNPADPREVAFSTTVNLPSLGAHVITTRATDIAGKITTDTRTVYRKAQPVVTWPSPAAIPFGTSLTATQLNAVATVGGSPITGTYSYTPAAGAVLPVGQDQVLSVTFTPTDQTRYLTAEASVTIDVLSSQPAIVWPAPASIGYGTALGAAQLNAAAEIDGAAIPGTFAYTPAAGTVLGAGTHQLSVTFTPADPSSYQGATGSVSIAVTPAALTVTADAASRTYGGANPAFTATVSGLVAGDDIADLGGALSFTTPAVAASDAGSYPVTPGGLTSANYAITFVDGALSVTPAPLTVTADDASRPYGAPNPAFGVSYGGLVLGQTAAVLGGALTVSTPAVAGSPIGTYAVTPSGLTSTNYAIAFVAGTLSVTPAALTITVQAASRPYGAANPPFALQFSGFQGSDTASVVTGTPTFTTAADASSPAGAYDVTPGGLSAANYAIAFLPGTLTVTPKALTITASDASRGYGQPDPTFGASFDGFVTGEGPGVLGGTLTFATTATAASGIGTYPIEVSGATSSNYTIVFVPGTLTITAGSLQVTAADASRAYGSENPAFGGTVTGVVAADGITVSYATTAVAGSPAGAYAIEPQLTDPNGRLGNYVVTLTPGTLTVSPAPLTVTAASASRGYGEANPAFTAAFDGFVLGQGQGDLDGALDLSTAATAASGVGTYPVAVSGLASSNYAITFVPGTLTITQAALAVTAGDASRAYGDADPAFTGTVTGLAPADGITVSYATTAEAGSPVGTYPIQPSLQDPNGRLANYLVTLAPGTLTVTARALTIAAADTTRVYGSASPAFTATYTGFAPGDGEPSLGGVLTFGGPAASATAAGAYAIEPGGVTSANYAITFVPGTLTITPAALTVTADSLSRVYGSVPAGFTASYQGFVNGDDPTDLAGALAFGGTSQSAVDAGVYTIVPSGLSSPNYAVQFVAGTLTITRASLTIRAEDKSMVLNGSLPVLTATAVGLVNGDTLTGLDTQVTLSTAATGQAIGQFAITAGGAADRNYTIAYAPGTLTVTYSTAACLGDPGRAVLQPVNVDGTSVFKQKSTVPVKFRVCDANGASVAGGVVSSFVLVQRLNGTATFDVNETPTSTTPDTTFRWDPTGQQWIFNLSTKNLKAGETYRYQIGLTDGSAIGFQFGLR